MIDPKSAGMFTETPVRIANPLGEELSCCVRRLCPPCSKRWSVITVTDKKCAAFRVGCGLPPFRTQSKRL